jgi:hypothetical protein
MSELGLGWLGGSRVRVQVWDSRLGVESEANGMEVGEWRVRVEGFQVAVRRGWSWRSLMVYCQVVKFMMLAFLLWMVHWEGKRGDMAGWDGSRSWVSSW